MKLRQWQSECASCAVQHYQTKSPDYFCLAAPGAGKSIMAAEVAKRLLDEDKIDFVLCFSPSKSVSQSLKNTFNRHLNKPFDGLMGSIGCSVTYQGMTFKDASFWQLLSDFRVFVIFDEIHHCAGTTLENSNAWGRKIISNIKDKSAYTLAMSGTPWRSNSTPIVLGQYKEPDFALECHYVYGLKRAVEDSVCRLPKLVLMDNNKIRITSETSHTTVYRSLQEVIEESECNYQTILSASSALAQILERANQTLDRIRIENNNAAGLVVASSIAHAKLIQQQLLALGQGSTLVTHRDTKALEIIEAFKSSREKWIISIGMISEGTDIPRLQVCCYLSRVKTELYFRQVLGRVLRRNNQINQEAWLFTFAEPSMVEFAHRLEQEIPEPTIVCKELVQLLLSSEDLDLSQALDHTSEWIDQPEVLSEANANLSGNEHIEVIHSDKTISEFRLDFMGDFREKVVETYQSPF